MGILFIIHVVGAAGVFRVLQRAPHFHLSVHLMRQGYKRYDNIIVVTFSWTSGSQGLH